MSLLVLRRDPLSWVLKPWQAKHKITSLYARLPADYRLLFPFEGNPETEGMWWELDHYRKR